MLLIEESIYSGLTVEINIAACPTSYKVKSTIYLESKKFHIESKKC